MSTAGDGDSGVESSTATTSKDVSPEKLGTQTPEDNPLDHDDDDDQDLEETLGERLWGLTEMFPNWIRCSASAVTTGSASAVKGLYTYGRVVTWVFFSSSALLFAPVIFEIERAQMDEMQKQQQRQILLGPNAAVSGGDMGYNMPLPHPPNLTGPGLPAT